MFLVLFYLQNLPQRGDKFSSIHINVNYNLIKDIRLRQILILNYIATDKLKDYDIYAIVGESESWYYPKKKQVLKEFEKTYRSALSGYIKFNKC